MESLPIPPMGDREGVGFTVCLVVGLANAFAWIFGLTLALFEKPIYPVTLEGAAMRSPSWPCEDLEEFMGLYRKRRCRKSMRPAAKNAAALNARFQSI